MVILVVAIVLLFVVGAMAVLAIDLVSFYSARSEAQLAADSGALAGARVLANSGTTSNPADLVLASNAKAMAEDIAKQVAASNKVGGRNLTLSEVTATATGSGAAGGALGQNPRVIVTVTRSDLPTFFARIWGTTQITLSATSNAEAYNPSGLNVAAGNAPPVAPTCVKPWVLPNLDPNGVPLFNSASGDAPNASTLIGWSDAAQPAGNFTSAQTPAASAWHYYAGASSSFPAPTSGLPNCGFALDDYQKAIVGCVPTPISCHDATNLVNLDINPYANRDLNTAQAVNCLTHATTDGGDQVTVYPPSVFQFLGGADNPVPAASGQNMLLSSSVVTVPVYNGTAGIPPNSVEIIGFVQLFLNPDGVHADTAGTPPTPIKTAIVNLVGCGTNASGTPVYGNGASPVAVRLITGGN